MEFEAVTEKWSNEVVLQFLDLFSEEPIIWKVAHPQHKSRNDVYEAWKRIQIALGYQFTVTELKKKKDSLMASFRTCIAKVKASRKNGAGLDDVYKPVWFAYEKMATFLMDKDESIETLNSEKMTEQSAPKYPRVNEAPTDKKKITRRETRTNTNERCNESNECELNLLNKRKREQLSDDSFIPVRDHFINPHPQQDRYDLFGKTIAMRMRSLDKQRRLIVEKKINDLLFEVEINMLNEDPNTSSPSSSPTTAIFHEKK